jgi:polyhydroxyalkanoate synthesis regulator phasin
MTAKSISDMCKAIRDLVRRGELTRQQGKTLMGQCKHGDLEGARKGLERLMRHG